jgi:hypothetical protein
MCRALCLATLCAAACACAGESTLPPAPDYGEPPDAAVDRWSRVDRAIKLDRSVARDQPKIVVDVRKPDLAPPPDAASPCASGETYFGAKCYRVTGIKYITYATAKAMCASQSPPMQIVAITSAAENQFVYGQLPVLNQVAWIGLTRTGTGAQDFAWETGEPVSYWNWASGEPNNENGKESCGAMWGPHLSTASFRSKWNDTPCDANVDAVICERAP